MFDVWTIRFNGGATDTVAGNVLLYVFVWSISFEKEIEGKNGFAVKILFKHKDHTYQHRYIQKLNSENQLRVVVLNGGQFW